MNHRSKADVHFKTLGLSWSQRKKQDIKTAYHKLAMVNHPDKIGPEGTERMKAINTAYETIMELELYDKAEEETGNAVPVTSYWPGVYGPHQPNATGVFKTKLIFKVRPRQKQL